MYVFVQSWPTLLLFLKTKNVVVVVAVAVNVVVFVVVIVAVISVCCCIIAKVEGKDRQNYILYQTFYDSDTTCNQELQHELPHYRIPCIHVKKQGRSSVWGQ